MFNQNIERINDKGVQARFENDELYLIQKVISELYSCTIDNVLLYLKKYKVDKLSKSLTCAKSTQVQKKKIVICGGD